MALRPIPLLSLLLCLLWAFGGLLCHRGRAPRPAGASPSRGVVSLSPALTELAYALGGGSSLVGRSSACDYPPEALSLPIMGDFALPDLERILALHPRVVVSNDLVNPGVSRALEAQGIAVEVLPSRNVAEYLLAVKRMGELLDCREAAGKEEGRVGKFLKEWAGRPGKSRRALVLVWDNPPMVAGEGTFCWEMLRLAGGDMDFQGREGYFVPGAEWLLSSQPECLVVFRESALHAPAGLLREWKSRMVLFPQEDLLCRPGPRWTQGVTLLREALP